jgi:hypothetical protein
MKWKEFKKLVENEGINDDTEIDGIDIGYIENEPVFVDYNRDDNSAYIKSD